jgi:hypothetical protein
MRVTRTSQRFVASMFLAGSFAYQVTANVIPLTDERSLTAYAHGYVIVPAYEARTDGPYAQTPSVAFGTFDPATVSASVFDGRAGSSADQNSWISVQSQTTWLYALGDAHTAAGGGETTFVGSAQGSSICRLGFMLDANYSYQAAFTLNATFGASEPPFGLTEAGYRLTGPSGEVFSFVRTGMKDWWIGAGPVTGSDSGSLVPGNYLFEAWAKSSADPYRAEYYWGNTSYSVELGLTAAGEPMAVPDAGCPFWLCGGTLLGLLGVCRSRLAR